MTVQYKLSIPFKLLMSIATVFCFVLNVYLSSSISTKFLSMDAVYRAPTNNDGFPKWLPEYIHIETLIQFGNALILNQSSTTASNADFQEILYVLDANGLFVSEHLRLRTKQRVHRSTRITPTEQMLVHAHSILKQEPDRWPRLQRIFTHNVSLPFYMWYGDYRGCAKDNWQPNDSEYVSVPLFTVCAAVDCQHAFPLPTYKTYSSALPSAADWDARFNKWRKKYSTSQKIPKVVWRGRLTNPIPVNNKYRDAIRWKAAELAHQHPEILDVGLTSVPSKYNRRKFNVSLIGGWKESITPMERYQEYAGILDLDGNSWSSRFGELLCYNSVVLKAEPEFVDLFMRDLEPNVHYIPVKGDLSDLLEKAAFVLDPKNTDERRRIMENAHTWCRHSMTHRALAIDSLNVLEQYVGYLDADSYNWPDKWKLVKDEWMQDPRFAMKSVKSNEI